MRSSISRGCRSLGNGNRSAVTGGLGPAHVRRESRGAPRLPSVSAFPRRRTPPFRPPRRSAPGEGRRTRARSAASSGARFPPLSAPPLQRLTGWPRDPALSWFSGRPDLRGGFDGLCCREEHCGALRPCDFLTAPATPSPGDQKRRRSGLRAGTGSSFSVSVPRRFVSVRPGAGLPGRGTTNRASASPRRQHATAARAPRPGAPALPRGAAAHTRRPKRSLVTCPLPPVLLE